MKFQTAAAALAACILVIGTVPRPARALDCSGSSRQTRPIDLGVGGGSIDEFGTIHGLKFCFSGTLGSMVQDASNKQFILSNNHVIDNINKSHVGETIVQPGLADVRCHRHSSDGVAKFSSGVKIKFSKNSTNTIDASIAAVESGKVNSDILNIGPIASTVVEASPGLNVKKMGRTTCLTFGQVASVAVDLLVNYGGKKNANFVNQIEIDGFGFGGPGDSGSLIVTEDTCPQAVGLLFAGSSDGSQTFANPISDVLSAFNVSMTGGCAAAAAAPEAFEVAGNGAMSKDVVDSAKQVRDRHEDSLMSIPGAVGTGIGVGDQSGQPTIRVYVKKITPEAKAAAPKDVEGIPVKLIENGGIVAY